MFEIVKGVRVVETHAGAPEDDEARRPRPI
jgi:hypothetical protein